MADLLTTETLARWTQKETAEVQADPLASEIITMISGLACYLGGHPDWSLEPGDNRVPIDVQMVVLQVAKRSYENPTQVTGEGNVGPVGGDTHVEQYALFMEFTDAERKIITKYNPTGDPDVDKGADIFTLKIDRSDDPMLQATTLYVSDNQQVNLETSADPRPWMIPLFNPSDPGDPNNYEPDYVEPTGDFANGGE